ncbi:hypothetical protein FGO68_gene4797 [Halteria grandinella]|uniref:TLDc domain-containing protein n=1 Tax=Halteria grandinella TaxID=5974 RepID=A0A8J8T2K3_HALGN|nr:hypothetical protein FGO68_gene4797 [Halteria grandinella]
MKDFENFQIEGQNSVTAKKLLEEPILFQDSLIITDKEKQQTMQSYFTQMGNSRVRVTLLYRATRDGFGVKNFHQTCDNKGPTIAIIQTTEDFVIGGYTDEHWQGPYAFKSSFGGWLFTLSHPHPIKRNPSSGMGILCNGYYGVNFGNWAIGVFDNSDANDDSYVHGPRSGEDYAFGGVHLFGGNGQRQFVSREIEVYGVSQY